MDFEETDALVVVDVQNDFCPGGALPVNEGNRVSSTINRLLPRFEHCVFTRDWHPSDHCSFADAPRFVDGSWPAHCVANSPGAEFHGELHVPVDALIVDKATESDTEAYSGFQNTALADELRRRGVKRLFVCGLATDYCVKHTALDGVKQGFEVFVVLDACRAVDAPRGSADRALEELRQASVTFCRSSELLE